MALAVGLLLVTLRTGAAGLPAELVSRKPEFHSFQLSASGSKVAYIRVGDDDLNSLIIFDLTSGEKRGVAGTTAYDVGGFAWVGDDQVVLTLTEDKLYGVGIYVYNTQTGRLAELRGFKNSNSGSYIMSVPRDRENRVIAATPGEDSFIEELTTKFDTKTRGFIGIASPVKRSYSPPKGRIRGYSSNVAGEPAIALVFEDDGFYYPYLLDQGDESWSRIPLNSEETPILSISADNQLAWVARRTADGGSALHPYDLITHEIQPAVYSDEDYDLATASLYLDQTGRELQGISYHRVRRHNVWFDDALRKIHERLQEALPGHDIVLTDRTEKRTKGLFVAVSSTDPGQYFLADLEDGGIKHVAAAAPWLEGVPLSPAASFNFKSRDGLELQAYLTLPTNPEAKKPYPLMVLGHGGPWARDRWRYDGEVQFLASRGIAVVQPNYRGSTGFDYAITVKDRFDFLKMHDDVTDAVKTLIRGGYADPERVGIMGASFGGYLAIAGAAWEPDLYRCAISNVGVFDWKMLLSDSRRESYISHDWFKKNIGDDPEKLQAFSPLHSADQIRCPVFIAHGRQDIRVDISQSVRLERALKSRGVPHETYYEGDSAHGFSAAEAQKEYLAAVDRFLDQYFFGGSSSDSL